MSDIKIFVSHRIDKKSKKVNNALFYPVRCGAVFDRNPSDIPGDDTGDNISQKRDSFCELTVLYWAWKNVKADYYGLCHYRRYFSFSEKKFSENAVGCIVSPEISEEEIDKFGIHEDVMRKKIEQYDVITTPAVSVTNDGGDSVYDFCIRHPEAYIKEDIDATLQIIDEKYAEYSEDAREFFNSRSNRWYHCNIMKRELFYDYCSWLFDILFELEKRIDFSTHNYEQTRIVGVMGERLFGVYYTHLLKQRKYTACELQLVYFENTEEEVELLPAYPQNNIPIVLFSSNFYVPYCAVFMQSVIEHASDNHFYDFIIFQKEITDENRQALSMLADSRKNISIRFYNPSAFIQGTQFHLNPGSSEEAYYRLLVPYALNNYDKVLCLDSDMIAKVDLAELFSQNLDEYVAGAVSDVVFHGLINGFSPEFMRYCKTDFKMKNPFHYVNTGVLLLNLKRFREEFGLDYVMNLSTSRVFKIQEQDALNLILEGRIKYLDPAWNLYTYCGGRYKKCVEYAPLSEYQNYMEARENPKIIHYAGMAKPWKMPQDDFAAEFWMVARRSIQYEMILERFIKGQPGFLKTNCEKLKKSFKQIAKKIFPWGTKRHVVLKRLYYRLRGWA
jgi:lipopolysaccharide biosynthesis glycosyltransferase